jgi:hypothetical protein
MFGVSSARAVAAIGIKPNTAKRAAQPATLRMNFNMATSILGRTHAVSLPPFDAVFSAPQEQGASAAERSATDQLR